MPLDEGQHLRDGDITSELTTQAGDAGVTNAAGHDGIKGGHIAVAVEGEAMQSNTSGHAHPDGRYLAVRTPIVRWHPDSTAPIDAYRHHADVLAGLHECILQSTHMAHHIKGEGQVHDRISHELTRAVPGDAAAAIHVNHGCAIKGSIEWLGPSACGVDGRVLEQEKGVCPYASHHARVHAAL